MRNDTPEDELAAQAEGGEPERARWSQLEQLLAVVADRIARVEYVLICANTDSKSKVPTPPEPIRRPGAKPLRAKAKLSEASADRLFQLINGGAS